MLADDVAYVIGVDTHADSHALALVEATSQRTRRQLTIPACRRGYRQALRLARRQAPGRRMWALEGSGCYGAGLARFLCERGERVLEVERPRRQGRRGRLKSDALDAERAARSVLAGVSGAAPRLGPETQALRALLVAREGAVGARTAAVNELRALVLTAPPSCASACRDARRPPCSRLAPVCGRVGARANGRPSRWRCARSLSGWDTCARKPTRSSESSPAGCRRSPLRFLPAAASVPSARPRSSSPGRNPGGCAQKRPSRGSPGSRPSPRARARSSATGSTAAAIAA